MAADFPVEFGEFTLLRKLAQGGMAELFVARDKRGQICALKRILPHLAHEEGFIRMFIDEARIVASLDHPNVARIFEQGKHQGYYYLALEYVDGHTLLALTERARAMKIVMPRGLFAYIIAELLAALDHAHTARDKQGRMLNIVHRDVTPQNVMISYRGEVKLIDFGVAKARARLTQTEVGFTKGKLSYMSPEQARGDALDGRSDVFSAGIVLYELTTGTRLFNKEGPGGILSAIVNEPVPRPTQKVKNYPQALEEIVLRALEKDVRARWQTADDMRKELLRFASNERPPVGRQRLADLVHDLFGPSNEGKSLATALSADEPTSARASTPASSEASLFSLAKSHANPRPRSARGDVLSAPAAKASGEETQLRVESEEQAAHAMLSAKLEVTRDSIAALATPLSHADVAVPEPKIDWQTRFWRTCVRFLEEARLGWRVHPRRRMAILSLVGLFLLVLVVGATGLVDWMAGVLGDAKERARTMRRQAGITVPGGDAGSSPKVTLRLSTEPLGALVTIDGIGAGCATPCDVEQTASPREQTIEFSLDGYRTRAETFVAQAGQGAIEITVALERALGSVDIRSEPSQADVVVDGKILKKKTPVVLDGFVAGKPVAIEVKKAGYRPRRWVAVPRDGQVLVETVTLELDAQAIPSGLLDVVTTPAGCTVRVDRASAGVSPIQNYEARPGEHTVDAECPYHAPATRTVVVASARTARVDIRLEANVFGYLTLTTIPPAGNTVTLNGRPIAQPIEFLKVVPGRHLVEVNNVALRRTKTISIDVGPERRVRREVNMFQ